MGVLFRYFYLHFRYFLVLFAETSDDLERESLGFWECLFVFLCSVCFFNVLTNKSSNMAFLFSNCFFHLFLGDILYDSTTEPHSPATRQTTGD